ncbi:MAG TPA: histidine kinase [Chitinophagaceae bacterium]
MRNVMSPALFLLFVLCFAHSNAQSPFYYVNATIYGEKEGYNISNQVRNITEDNDGLIWISSESGLQSFNGTQFKNYSHSTKNPHSLPGNYVQFIYEDKEGTHWTYIRHKGLYIYDPHTENFSRYQYRNEKDFNLHQSHQFEIGQPFEDKHGRLWVPLIGYGLAEIDKKKNTVIPYKICFPNNCGSFYDPSWVTNIFEDDKGTFWLATNGGLVYFNARTGIAEEIIEPELQNRVTQNERTSVFNFFGPQIKNDIWIGTWGSGIKKLNTITRRFETYLWHPKTWDGTKNICTGIWQKDSTHLWISTQDKELFVFDLQTHKFHPVRLLSDEGFVFATGKSIQAKDGSLWLVHINGALIKINNKQLFSSYSFKNEQALIPELLNSSCFLKIDNSLFIGAGYDTRIYKYDMATQSHKSYRVPGKHHKGETNFLLSAPGQNGFYAGGYYGLVFFNTLKQEFENLKTDSSARKLLNQELICATLGKDSSIWMGCRNNNRLLRYFPGTGKVNEYQIMTGNDSTKLPYNEYWVTSIVAGDHNNIWFSHSHYGLGSLHIPDGKTVFLNSLRKKNFPIGFSTSICKANDGSIFFTIIGEGVWRLKHPFSSREEIINYDHTNGLPSDNIRFVHEDKQQNIWFFSNNGLSLFDPESGTSKNFSDADGLKSKNLTIPPYEDADGHIYLGYHKAFQTFQPGSLAKKEIQTSKLIVFGFKVNNKNWPANINYVDKIVLKPEENYLHFQYAAITHDNPQQLSYSYILEKFDKDWIQAGNTTTGTYNNLPAGEYTLKIKLNDGKEANETNYFERKIVVSGYWYNSTWFRVLLGIALFSLIYMAHRYRIAVLRKEARLKAEYAQKLSEVEMRALRAQMNPHFIFNCLSSINRYIVKSDHKTASGYLTKFSKLIRLILDNSLSDSISIEKELQSLQLYIDMETLRFDHAFTYTLQIDDNLDREDSFIPPMLLQPYVENAIWHGLLHKESGIGKLTITLLKVSDTKLKVCIEDNGIGRPMAKELKSKEVADKKSHGMQINRERLALLNHTKDEPSSVLIEDLVSESGKALGTRVTLQIPMQKQVD